MKKKIAVWLTTAFVVMGLVFPPCFGPALAEELAVPAENAVSRVESTSADLARFLTNIACDAPVDENGDYVVDPNGSYELTLAFRENEVLQFDNDVDLVYELPAGLLVPDVSAAAFDIRIVDKDGPAVVSGNAFAVSGGKLIVRFNQDDPNIERLKALANVVFSVALSVQFDEGAGGIVFNSDIEKNFVFESNADLTIAKQVAYDSGSDTAHYVLTVTSLGSNENVKIQDVVTGTALTLNWDVTVVSSLHGALSPDIDYASTENGFNMVIPAMENNEVLTIEYSAAVDNTKITGNGTSGQTGNTARVSSDQVPDGKEASANFAGQVRFHKISKAAAGDAAQVGENQYEQTWVIEVNKDHKMLVGGTGIMDEIPSRSRPFMHFTGDGITVEVAEEDGSTEVRDIPWSQLRLSVNSDGIYRWTYQTPGSDGRASYKITCKTIIDASQVLGGLSLVNRARVYDSYGEAEVSITTGAGSAFGLEKNVVDSTSAESEWELVVHVDGTGYSNLKVVDDVPMLAYEGANYLDSFQEDSLVVEGLLEGESYRLSLSDNRRSIVLDFYQDGEGAQLGLKPTSDGEPRDIVIRFKTLVNQDWLSLADANGYERYHRHVNNASATVSGNRRAASNYVVPRKESIRKEFAGSRFVEISGVAYPAFDYVLILSNPGSDAAEIADAFDTGYLRYCEGSEGGGITISGGTASSQGNSDGSISAQDTDDGIDIRVSRFPVDANGNRYPVYKIRYTLVVKGETALDALNRAALEQGGYGLRNVATWNSLTSNTVETVYTYYPYVDKELVAPANADNGYVAEFKLIINKYAEDLDPASDVLHIQDALSPNLRFIQDSLTIEPAAGSIKAQFDSDTNTLTLTDIPDNTTYEVTYRARVLGKGNLTYSNTVKFGSYEKTVEGSVTVESSGAGSGSNPSITLVKRDAEDLSITLSGATFQLFYLSEGSPVPVMDRNGAVVEFTTGADGTVMITGNQSVLGWALWEGRTYQLVEVSAPEGYRLNEDPIEFILTETPSNQVEYDLVGDRIDVFDDRDEPGGDEPGGDEPGGDEPGGDEPGGDEPGGDEPHVVIPEAPVDPEPTPDPDNPGSVDPEPAEPEPGAPEPEPGDPEPKPSAPEPEPNTPEPAAPTPRDSSNVQPDDNSKSRSSQGGGFLPKAGDNVVISLLEALFMLVVASVLLASAVALARRTRARSKAHTRTTPPAR